MSGQRTGKIAVIFVNQRTGEDEEGYLAAAQRMETLASQQAGYCGIDSVRGTDGTGITVSYWADDAAAKAWRDNPEHAAIREQGRGRWYQSYDLTVARVERDYQWSR